MNGNVAFQAAALSCTFQNSPKSIVGHTIIERKRAADPEARRLQNDSLGAWRPRVAAERPVNATHGAQVKASPVCALHVFHLEAGDIAASHCHYFAVTERRRR